MKCVRVIRFTIGRYRHVLRWQVGQNAIFCTMTQEALLAKDRSIHHHPQVTIPRSAFYCERFIRIGWRYTRIQISGVASDGGRWPTPIIPYSFNSLQSRHTWLSRAWHLCVGVFIHEIKVEFRLPRVNQWFTVPKIRTVKFSLCNKMS